MTRARHSCPFAATLACATWLGGCTSQFGDLGVVGSVGDESTGEQDDHGEAAPELQWRVEIEHGTPFDRICDVAVLSGDRVAVSGVSASEPDGAEFGGQGWIRIYRATGELVVERVLPADHAPLAVDADEADNLFVVGGFGRTGTEGGTWLAVYGPDGDELWYRTRTQSGARFSLCAPTHDAVSLSESYVASDATLSHVVVAVDGNGENVHELGLGEPAIGRHALAEGPNDTYYAISTSTPGMGPDLAVVGRFHPSGQAVWRRENEGPGNIDVFSGPEGEVYVTDLDRGVTRYDSGGQHEWTLAYPDANAGSPVYWDPQFVSTKPFDVWVLVLASPNLEQSSDLDLDLPLGYMPERLEADDDLALYVFGTHGEKAAWLGRHVRQ